MIFIAMVKGVWGVKEEQVDVSQRGIAGGNDPSINSRDRYIKQNNKGTPFGTSQGSAGDWETNNKQQYTKKDNTGF